MNKKFFITAIGLLVITTIYNIQGAAGSGSTALTRYENLLQGSTATPTGLLEAFIELEPSERVNRDNQVKLVTALLAKEIKPEDELINKLSEVTSRGTSTGLPLFSARHPLMQWLRNKNIDREVEFRGALGEYYALDAQKERAQSMPSVIEDQEYRAPIAPVSGLLFADADPAQFLEFTEAGQENDEEGDMLNTTQILNDGSRPIYIRIRTAAGTDMIPMVPNSIKPLAGVENIFELPSNTKIIIPNKNGPLRVRFWPYWIKAAKERNLFDAKYIDYLAYAGVIVREPRTVILNHNNPTKEVRKIQKKIEDIKDAERLQKYNTTPNLLPEQHGYFNQVMSALQAQLPDQAIYNPGLAAVMVNHPANFDFLEIVKALTYHPARIFMPEHFDQNPEKNAFQTIAVFDEHKEESLFDKLLRNIP